MYSPFHRLPQDAVNCQGMHHSQFHLHHAWGSAGTVLGDSFYRVQRHPSTDLVYTLHDLLIAGREDLGLLQRAPRQVCTLSCSSALLLHVGASVTVKGDLRQTKSGYRALELRCCSPWSCQWKGKARAGEPPTHGLRPDCTASVADTALAFMAMDPYFEEQGQEHVF